MLKQFLSVNCINYTPQGFGAWPHPFLRCSTQDKVVCLVSNGKVFKNIFDSQT